MGNRESATIFDSIRSSMRFEIPEHNREPGKNMTGFDFGFCFLGLGLGLGLVLVLFSSTVCCY